ncbi:Hsp20 family protein [Rhodovarius crocodyli]|uniref:Hsp20 family protein n=1 Tax=Rhodovarius crocodyli TaxID=1979269 RepID=A0A437MIL1_9PROT|nr:Hsp20 family protein [Rhodovarius crocodyli]RVT97480.1 Hsp20 family protein [Rhodovarius crocodyli]
MNAVDFSPLFRTAIGFDRLARLVEGARGTEAQSYPPYNIERTGEDNYVLTLAVAGFSEQELELEVKGDTLLVAGRPANQATERSFLHRGIAGRAFERRFVLADHLVVKGAELRNGLLHVALERVVPEALKPRRIEIASAGPAQPKLVEAQAA